MTLQLTPGQSSFDWGELLEPGPDSEEFLQPPVHPTPTEKQVGFAIISEHLNDLENIFILFLDYLLLQAITKIVKSIWKPWNYFMGTEDEEGTKDPSGRGGDKEITTKQTDNEPKASTPGYPGSYDCLIS